MTRRERVLDAFRAACARADLAGRVRAATESHSPELVLAVGKAATSMLAGVTSFRRALVVIPAGVDGPPEDPRVEVLRAAHPLPDASSLVAAERALAFAGSDEPNTVDGARLFLVSGGASALLCAPAPPLTLEDKRRVVAELLHAQLGIRDVNVVRRHLSRIKGGGLARAAARHPRRTLIVSDVIGGAAHDVGSGPSVDDPTTIDDARRVAHRLGLPELPWVETWKTPEQHAILIDPTGFAALVRDELAVRGLEATVAAAEPTFRIPRGAGRGGRCTHVAAIESLSLPKGALFAAIATDGVDGASGTGGAIVEGPIPGAAQAIAEWNTGPLHVAAGTAIPSKPTGVNFADVHIRVG